MKLPNDHFWSLCYALGSASREHVILSRAKLRRADVIAEPAWRLCTDGISGVSEPAVGQGQQGPAAIGGDAPAIEGGADFLAPRAWQIDKKAGIVVPCGGGGASCVPDRLGFDIQILFQNKQLR